jgi:hypothetical protein
MSHLEFRKWLEKRTNSAGLLLYFGASKLRLLR